MQTFDALYARLTTVSKLIEKHRAAIKGLECSAARHLCDFGTPSAAISNELDEAREILSALEVSREGLAQGCRIAALRS